VLLFKYSYGFIALPGGIGTTDELFEALTLIQTKKILNYPVVLMGTQYWTGLTKQLQDMLSSATIDPPDLKLMLTTDDVTQALAHIERHAIDRFGLTRRRIKSSRLLGEPPDDVVVRR
jgi:predicted Rossmann-fold nucleotide-binding protein